MKAIKYLLAGALITVVSAPSVAQDVKSQVEAIKKVIVENKANPEASQGKQEECRGVGRSWPCFLGSQGHSVCT